MVWKELLAMLPGSAAEAAEAAAERVSAKLDELLAAVEEVAVGLEEDLARQALIRLEWRASSFSPAMLEALWRAAPRPLQVEARALRDRLRQALDLIAHKARSSAHDLLALRPQLLALHIDLGAFLWRLRKDARRVRRLRTLALLVPSLLAAAAAAYLRSDRGLQLVRIEGSAPAAAYVALTSSDGVLAPRPDYLEDFMREFSKFYFGHPSQFESLYYDQEPVVRPDKSRHADGKRSKKADGRGDSRPEPDSDSPPDAPSAPSAASAPEVPDGEARPRRRRTLQHKLSLRNASHGEVSYISSVEAVIEASEPAAFPWPLLTVTPHVKVEAEDPLRYRTLMVHSDGIGPAVELTGSVKASSGLEVIRWTLPLLHRDRFAVFGSPASGVGVQPMQGGAISPPLYLRLARPPEGAQAARAFEVKEGSGGDSSDCEPRPADYGFYEEVRTPARLSELTQTAHTGPWALELRYASLRGDADTIKLSGAFDGSEIYYRATPTLLGYDPRCPRPGERGVGGGLAELVTGGLGEAAMFFAEDRALAQPRGVDLLTARLGADLVSLPVGSRVAAADPLDGFLNPQGVLAVYLTLNMPASLRYSVTLRVNGQPAARYRFDGLVPEFLTFEGEGRARAVARLRQIFRDHAGAPARK